MFPIGENEIPSKMILDQILTALQLQGKIDSLTQAPLSSTRAELENITNIEASYQERENDMARIKKRITIAGYDEWITGANEKAFYENLVKRVAETTAKSISYSETFAPCTVTFAEYARKWLETEKQPTVAPTTYENYTQRLVPICNYLGERTLDKKDTPCLIAYFAGRKHVANSTVRQEYTILNMIFAAATEDGLLSKNPMLSKRIRAKGTESESRQTLPIEAFQNALTKICMIENAHDRGYFALLSVHGMRPEEVRGLQWQDVDMDKNLIHIRRAVTYPKKNQPVIGEPKTKASKADIGLVESIKPFLTPGAPEDFLTGGKKPRSWTELRNAWKRICKAVGLQGITESQFRTTMASLLYEKTGDITSVKKLMRHTQTSTTMNHSVKCSASPKAIARTLDDICFEESKAACDNACDINV